LHLYESMGFVRLPAEGRERSQYSRSDVRMEMDI
jgi:hypothetical protein